MPPRIWLDDYYYGSIGEHKLIEFITIAAKESGLTIVQGECKKYPVTRSVTDKFTGIYAEGSITDQKVEDFWVVMDYLKSMLSGDPANLAA